MIKNDKSTRIFTNTNIRIIKATVFLWLGGLIYSTILLISDNYNAPMSFIIFGTFFALSLISLCIFKRRSLKIYSDRIVFPEFIIKTAQSGKRRICFSKTELHFKDIKMIQRTEDSDSSFYRRSVYLFYMNNGEAYKKCFREYSFANQMEIEKILYENIEINDRRS